MSSNKLDKYRSFIHIISLKKSFPLSSIRIKAGKSTTSIIHTASMPIAGKSRHSDLLAHDNRCSSILVVRKLQFCWHFIIFQENKGDSFHVFEAFWSSSIFATCLLCSGRNMKEILCIVPLASSVNPAGSISRISWPLKWSILTYFSEF